MNGYKTNGDDQTSRRSVRTQRKRWYRRVCKLWLIIARQGCLKQQAKQNPHLGLKLLRHRFVSIKLIANQWLIVHMKRAVKLKSEPPISSAFISFWTMDNSRTVVERRDYKSFYWWTFCETSNFERNLSFIFCFNLGRVFEFLLTIEIRWHGEQFFLGFRMECGINGWRYRNRLITPNWFVLIYHQNCPHHSLINLSSWSWSIIMMIRSLFVFTDK